MRYPVVLVHGVGHRERERHGYWRRIPAVIEGAGARVYYCGQDAWGTVEGNAEEVKRAVERALAETGAEKVNLIAHSKGGLEARFAISRLGMAGRAASLTTVSTPHHGSRTMDWLCRMPAFLLKAAAVCVNAVYGALGDSAPDFYNVCGQLRTGHMERFNKEAPDAPGVRYFSYAAAMRSPLSDVLMCLPCLVVSRFDGENDGPVGVESAEWGEFLGVIRGAGRRGVSHCDVVDRRRFKRGLPDICGVYVGVIERLTALGF